MLALLLVLALALGSDRLVLREDAQVDGRFVRLLDLVETDGLSEAARARLGSVYLGRSPEEGRTRTITPDEVRRELDRRGLSFDVAGTKVEVARGVGDEPLRRALAFEVKRLLLDLHPSLKPGEITVRLAADLRGLPAEAEISDLKARVPALPGAGDFSAKVAGRDVRGQVRVLRAREIVVAARDLPAGKVLEEADLESRRIEVGGDEGVLADPSLAIGAAARVRIAAGSVVAPSDLRMKPVVRKGDVVRVVTRDFEVDAKAAEDGAVDSVIALEFVSTKNRVRARVTGAGQVRIVENDR